MKVKSFAKINLAIEVLGKRQDGYHEIRTLFQSIDFFDELEFEPWTGGRIGLRGDRGDVPWDERNLIHKAARLLQESCRVNRGVRITVTKRIPPGKGMGGGSSNAAVTLWALNRAWDLGLAKEKLMDFGRLLGADVPYFLEGGLCLGEGRGDRIRPLQDFPPLPCCLILPPFFISTAEAYGRWRPRLTSSAEPSKITRFLAGNDFGLLENDLETAAFDLNPRLKDFKSLFPREKTLLSMLSGSGAALFALFPGRDVAEMVFETARREAEALLVETLPRERYWNELVAGVSPSGKATDFGSVIRRFESSRPSLPSKVRRQRKKP